MKSDHVPVERGWTVIARPRVTPHLVTHCACGGKCWWVLDVDITSIRRYTDE